MFVVVNGQMLKKLPSSQLGTLVVVASVLAFHSDGQSPNPAEAFSLFSVKCCKCCLAQSLCSVSCLIHGFFDPILDDTTSVTRWLDYFLDYFSTLGLFHRQWRTKFAKVGQKITNSN